MVIKKTQAWLLPLQEFHGMMMLEVICEIWGQ